MINAMNYRNFGTPMCLLVLAVIATEASASSWTCKNAEITREVVVDYPNAPSRLPCKVFYAKPKQNVLPRTLWQSTNTENYCELKAATFIEKLSSLGWQCHSSDDDE